MGRSLDEFWCLTLRQIDIIFKGNAQKSERDYELAYYTAYHSGLFSQFNQNGKPLDYKKHSPTNKKAAPDVQSWEQQKSMAMALNAAFGGTFH